MHESSVWRALPSLRLLLLAGGLALGGIVLAAASASADDSAPTVTKLGQAVAKPVPVVPARLAVRKPVALIKPAPAALKPVGAVLTTVAATEPVATAADRGGAVLAKVAKVAKVDKAVALDSTSRSSTIRVKVAAGRADKAGSYTGRAPAPGVAPSPSRDALGRALSRVGLSFAPTSPRSPGGPLSSLLAVASGSGATGTGSAGHGTAAADVTDGPHTSRARLLGGLPHDFWVLPRSLANDPSSSPD